MRTDYQVKLPAGVTAGVGRSAEATAAAAKEFEVTLLSMMLDAALPKSDGSFGKGFAGSVARSQLTAELARSIAARGPLGLVPTRPNRLSGE